MLGDDPQLRLSISFTTRPPRPGEEDGRDYHFVDRDRFLALQGEGEFLEHAEVHGNSYATSKRQITEGRRAGYDVVLEIDWQGATQVRSLFDDVVSVFILPPSLAELERRLRARG
ncbi:MAG: guanylate kinase, partial [Casimicrobiaceae bacterium]